MHKIYITEDITTEGDNWYLSFAKPYYQGGDTIEIDERTAYIILRDLKIVLKYIEDHNKQDEDINVAQAASNLEELFGVQFIN